MGLKSPLLISNLSCSCEEERKTSSHQTALPLITSVTNRYQAVTMETHVEVFKQYIVPLV